MGLIVRISVPLILYVLLSILGQCEMSIYPGLRRKPLSQALHQQQQQQAYEVSDTDFLSQLMGENARRRLQQQFEQQLELINMQLDHQRQREKDFRRRQQERERFKQNQLHRHYQKQHEQQQRELMNEADWRELKEAGNSMAAQDNLEYATTYTYNKNKNRNRPYAKYETATSNTLGKYNYKYPNLLLAKPTNLRERIPFAVPPSDPRFFQEDDNINTNYNTDYDESDEVDDSVRVVNDNDSIESDDDIDLRTLDEYEEYTPSSSTPKPIIVVGSDISQHTDNAVKSAPSFPAGATISPTQSSAATFHRIKPANAIAAAAVVAGVQTPAGSQNVLRHDINALIDKLQKEGGSKEHETEPHLVVRHYMGMNDSDWAIYFVALIAGLSAALTVGLIAMGLAWVHNKTKAAADVEYPAYGVTGPNRDISPSGDRKLAQSAQMYHYQHQKQQIMAMENRPVEGGLSDVESDDDNEEGDYTVYECPGLAPTGEMEVKNPLFLDETPVTTPSNIANVATPTPPVTVTVNTKTTHVNLKHKKENNNNGKTSTESKKKENKK